MLLRDPPTFRWHRARGDFDHLRSGSNCRWFRRAMHGAFDSKTHVLSLQPRRRFRVASKANGAPGSNQWLLEGQAEGLSAATIYWPVLDRAQYLPTNRGRYFASEQRRYGCDNCHSANPGSALRFFS
jgi:hypothetical protein